MFHPRQPAANHHQPTHSIHHQWYHHHHQAYHHQTGFAPTEDNLNPYHHITPHLYPPSPDLNDYLHGVNFQQGYAPTAAAAMMGAQQAQHARMPAYGVDVGDAAQMPSPVSGSDLSSPGLNSGEMSPQGGGGALMAGHQVARPPPVRSPYEWIKKNSYQNQPNPGKTRTKDKYRVVYTDHQRVELEKEFYFSRYITIRKKSELAMSLGLSERQVKIWFQNRRAKERKQSKKRQEMALTKDPLDLTPLEAPHQQTSAVQSQQQQQQSQNGVALLGHNVSPNQGMSLM